MDLKETVAAAKAEGLSYGEYVLKHSPPVTVAIPQDGSEPQVTQSEEPEKSREIEKTCLVCGKSFLVGPTQHRKMYCSGACKDSAAKKNAGKPKSKAKTEPDMLCPANSEHDPVNHPDHYTQGGIECKDAIKAAVTGLEGYEAFLTGNAIKYLWRWKRKNGTEDLRKAEFWIRELIDETEARHETK